MSLNLVVYKKWEQIKTYFLLPIQIHLLLRDIYSLVIIWKHQVAYNIYVNILMSHFNYSHLAYSTLLWVCLYLQLRLFSCSIFVVFDYNCYTCIFALFKLLSILYANGCYSYLDRFCHFLFTSIVHFLKTTKHTKSIQFLFFF